MFNNFRDVPHYNYQFQNWVDKSSKTLKYIHCCKSTTKRNFSLLQVKLEIAEKYIAQQIRYQYVAAHACNEMTQGHRWRFVFLIDDPMTWTRKIPCTNNKEKGLDIQYID